MPARSVRELRRGQWRSPKRYRRSADFAARASSLERGNQLRTSGAENCTDWSRGPLRKPCPRGLQGTNPIPSSSQTGSTSALGISGPEGVLVLDGGNRLDRMGTTNRFGPHLGETKVCHLALLDQLLGSAGDLFDGHLRVGRGADRGRSIRSVLSRWGEPSTACRMWTGRLFGPRRLPASS
jgi:hypothetical protein